MISVESTTENENVIVIKQLSKSFGKLKVLTGIDLNLKKGENLGVLGKSGTGKSVLIKCIVLIQFKILKKVLPLPLPIKMW